MSSDFAHLAGIAAGAFLGFLIGLAIVARRGAGEYHHVGGGWFEVIKPASHGFTGCLVEIVFALLGAGVGYLVGGMLAG